MPSEKKTSKVKVTVPCSKTLRTQFSRHCADLNVSAAQRIRDLMQKDLKKRK